MSTVPSVSETCGLREAHCVCDHDADHSGPHHCECGGEWDFDADGNFIAVCFPMSAPNPGDFDDR